MIHTLISDCYLYKVNRYRTAFEIRMAGQRRAWFLTITTSLLISSAVVYLIIYK